LKKKFESRKLKTHLLQDGDEVKKFIIN